eukprot:5535781-Alexandrium_andersonii.AAC.1
MSRRGPLYLDDPPVEEDLGRPWDHVPYRTWRKWRQDVQRGTVEVVDERCRNVLSGALGDVQRL